MDRLTDHRAVPFFPLVQVAYVAGIIEGEGSISIRREDRHTRMRYRVDLRILMRDREPVAAVAAMWGGVVRRNARGLWWSTCPAPSVATFLLLIIPFMSSARRRREAELLVQLRSTDPIGRRRLYAEMQTVKHGLWEEAICAPGT